MKLTKEGQINRILTSIVKKPGRRIQLFNKPYFMYGQDGKAIIVPTTYNKISKLGILFVDWFQFQNYLRHR